MSSSRSPRAPRRAPHIRKPWYKRTATRLGAGAGVVGIGVATSLATGVAQKVLGVDASPSPSPAASASVAPQRNVPLVSAAATVVEDLDQDIWIADRPVTLSPAQSLKINDDKVQGAQQGRPDDYLSDMTALGAVKSTGVALDLNLSTQAAGQVRINRIRVESQCRAPLAGTIFYSPPAGPAEAIGKIGFNLDDPAPTAREMIDRDGGQVFGEDFFTNKVQYLKRDDGFAYHVVVQAQKHYCEFRLKIDASLGGASQTVTVDDHGRPFRVSGLICAPTGDVCPKFSAYGRAYAGGVVNPNGKGNWIPKDPRTYDGL